MSIWANSPFCPELFLILARLFWNQILIWFSFKPNSVARFRLRSSVRYRLSSNSFFNRANCSAEKAVLGRFSSFLSRVAEAAGVEPGSRSSRFLMRRDRGPVKSRKRFYGLWHLTRPISSTTVKKASFNLHTQIKYEILCCFEVLKLKFFCLFKYGQMTWAFVDH